MINGLYVSMQQMEVRPTTETRNYVVFVYLFTISLMTLSAAQTVWS